MKKYIRFILILMLTLFLCNTTSVYADNLIGDENSTAIGSTSVTARVELPDETLPDQPGEDGIINTGDDVEMMKYIFMIAISGLIIVVVLRKHQINEE